MQVWACDASARSTLPDGVTLFYVGSFPDQEFREVHVQGENEFPMVNCNEATFEVHVAGDRDATGISGNDLRA